jgi:hypothetical protein
VRCKIRLRDIVRSVSCISGEAAIHDEKDRLMILFVSIDFDMQCLWQSWGFCGQGCIVFPLFPLFWFVLADCTEVFVHSLV